MKLTRAISSIFAAVMLGGLMLFAPAFAAPQNDSSFSALQGVEAQALSAEEMQAISGELNAFDIAAAIGAQALAATDPKVAKALADLSLYFFRNAEKINAYFQRLHILTDCKVCIPQ